MSPECAKIILGEVGLVEAGEAPLLFYQSHVEPLMNGAHGRLCRNEIFPLTQGEQVLAEDVGSAHEVRSVAQSSIKV